MYFYIGDGGPSIIYLPTDYLPSTISPTAFDSIKLNNTPNLEFKIYWIIKVIDHDYSDRVCYNYSISKDTTIDNYIKNELVPKGDAKLIPTDYYGKGSLYKISFSSIDFNKNI